VLDPFIDQFDALFLAGLRRKIGLSTAADGDAELVRNLLTTMQRSRADFTLTFRRLTLMVGKIDQLPLLRELFSADSDIESWLGAWQDRLASEPLTPADRVTLMRGANPAFIPRNHRVQSALAAAEAGDYEPFRKLLGILQRPYDDQTDMAAEYGQPPQQSERVLQTFCGT